MKKRVLLVDDHEIVREGLRSLIDQQTDLQVVGEACTGREALQLARKLKPDVIIMDVSMPDLNGIDAAHQILADQPSTRIVALSMHSDKRFVVGMLKAGALGFVLKESAFSELVQAVRAAVDQQVFVSPRIAGNVIIDFMNRVPDEELSVAHKLTTREREVLQMIAEGKSTRDISDALFISVKTVEARRRSIMKKLDLHSVAELTRFAIHEGLISLEK